MSSGRRSSRLSGVPPSDGSNNSDAIKVVCRFRPIPTIRREALRDDYPDSLKVDIERNEVECLSDLVESKSFAFDKVFGVDTTQIDLFNEVSGVVGSVMGGFNGTIMAYGQTAAGKSFSMEGPSLWDTQYQGIIPRCVDALFEEIGKADSDIQFQIVLSYYEIYCEKIRDLLNPSLTNMKLRENKTGGFKVADLTEIYCTDRENVLRVIELGKANRAAAPTLMNADSSRSHSIVSLLVDQKNTATGRNRRGILFLVDLAGSEKVSKTGASGMRLEEAKNINSSLTTLGMVINALCDGAGHVPYRDSKLTMILMDALGGNSRTTLIICCNPDPKHLSETVSTLRFGERAKRIKNHAKINEDFSVEELKGMLATAKKEIIQLKKKIQLLCAENQSLGGSSATELGSFNSNNMSFTIDNDDYTTSSTQDLDSPSLPSFGSPLGTRSISNTNNNTNNNINTSNWELEEELRNELENLKARIVTLEEDLQVEREKYQEEQSQRLILSSQSEALQSTIHEMEDKLLQATLLNRNKANQSSSNNNNNNNNSTVHTLLSSSSTSNKNTSDSNLLTTNFPVAPRTTFQRIGLPARKISHEDYNASSLGLDDSVLSLEDNNKGEMTSSSVPATSFIRIGGGNHSTPQDDTVVIVKNLFGAQQEEKDKEQTKGTEKVKGKRKEKKEVLPSPLEEQINESSKRPSLSRPSYEEEFEPSEEEQILLDTIKIDEIKEEYDELLGSKEQSQEEPTDAVTATATAVVSVVGPPKPPIKPKLTVVTNQQQLQQQQQAAAGEEQGSPQSQVPSESSLSPLPTDSGSMMLSPSTAINLTLAELRLQSRSLHTKLELEVQDLTRHINEQEIENKTAKQSTENLTDKYIKLREEYELHVQRLMCKLTEEQQQRAMMEDKLETAYSKLYEQSNNNGSRTPSRSRGFFSSLFGGNNNQQQREADGLPSTADTNHYENQNHYNTRDSTSSNSNHNSRSSTPTMIRRFSFSSTARQQSNGPSDKEIQLTKSLEQTQNRMHSLITELDATKEAQMIVLETKESVMRSLAKQNSQLLVERDSLNRKTEELTKTVEELASLLRHTQARHQQEIRITGRNGPTGVIGGGGHHANRITSAIPVATTTTTSNTSSMKQGRERPSSSSSSSSSTAAAVSSNSVKESSSNYNSLAVTPIMARSSTGSSRLSSRSERIPPQNKVITINEDSYKQL